MLTIVVPVYNERATVRALLDRVMALPVEKQVIVVDDGSTDGTSDVLRELPPTPELEIVRNAVNLGKGASVRIAVDPPAARLSRSRTRIRARPGGSRAPRRADCRRTG